MCSCYFHCSPSTPAQNWSPDGCCRKLMGCHNSSILIATACIRSILPKYRHHARLPMLALTQDLGAIWTSSRGTPLCQALGQDKMINQWLPANTQAVNRVATPSCIRVFDNKALLQLNFSPSLLWSISGAAYQLLNDRAQVAHFASRPQLWHLGSHVLGCPVAYQVCQTVCQVLLSGTCQSDTLYSSHRGGVAVASTVRQGFRAPSTCFTVCYLSHMQGLLHPQPPTSKWQRCTQ